MHLFRTTIFLGRLLPRGEYRVYTILISRIWYIILKDFFLRTHFPTTMLLLTFHILISDNTFNYVVSLSIVSLFTFFRNVYFCQRLILHIS